MEEILLEAEALTKSYDNLCAVKELSLKLRKGKICGLLGPNGAGKTTTIKMLCGLLKPDGGRIKTPETFRVGYCPQENILWENLTCLEQIRLIGGLFGMPAPRLAERARELLVFFELETHQKKLAGTLSGGMKRKLNIILSVINDPAVVILDEPEAGLDTASRVHLRQYMQLLAEEEKAVLITGHNIFEIEQTAEYIYIMEGGRIILEGEPRGLIARHTLQGQPCRNLEDLFIALTGRSLID